MKRIFTLLFLSTIIMTGWAQTVEIDGIVYNLNSEDKTAEVKQKSPKYEGDIVIPASVTNEGMKFSVTSIREDAFYNCSSLTSVTIPNSVTSIGNNAFYKCSGLTSVTIPNSVTSIGDRAFYNCSGLTSITIPNSVTSIGYDAFNGCASLPVIDGIRYTDNTYTYLVRLVDKSLTDVRIKEGTRFIGNSAFFSCSSLTSVTIPNTVTSIGNEAFYGCQGLTSVTIPNTVTSIGNEAFYGCQGLTSVNISDIEAWCKISFVNNGANPLAYAHNLYINGKLVTDLDIPNSVTSIGSYAFNGCSSLTSITIPNSVTSIGNSAFSSCSGLTFVNISDIEAWCKISFGSYEANPLVYAQNLNLNGKLVTDLVIPNSVTSIGNDAFNGCSGLTSVTIPNSVTSIGNNAFYKCSGLTSVTIGNSVTSIGNDAFNGCSGLTSVTIGNSVTRIGNTAFNGCQLKDVMMRNETPAKTDEKTFSDRSYQHASLYVPAGSWTDYVYGKGYWYKFNKIYETAQSVETVSDAKAYMLMDDNFDYAVYDPINDKVSLVNSTSVDGINPNHVWMMVKVKDKQYLYNLGAKKFAVPSMDGTSFNLSESAASIEAENGDNGIVLNSHREKQWNLTDRAQMGGVEDFEEMVTAITTTQAEGAKVSATYTLDGKQTTSAQRGVRIIHYTDGTTKKVI